MEEWEADAAEADADPVPDEAAAEVWEPDVEEAAADEELELALFAAVAFRVPHFSSLLHVAWPSASFGWLLMHCS
jgi:hypothetical protein